MVDRSSFEDGLVSFSAGCSGPIEAASIGEQKFVFVFDIKEGRLASYYSAGHWKDYTEPSEESLTLSESTRRDPAFIEEFRRDAARYFDAMAEYHAIVWSDRAKLVTRAREIGVDTVLSDARKILAEALPGVKDPQIEALLERQIAQHDKNLNYRTQQLERFDEILGQPSAEWTAKDLEGDEHSLADYRGKVAVLDFWFRKCNCCIRAHPQFAAVVKHFQGQPVPFLGMNVDEEIEDARFAVEKMKIDYPTLQASKLRELYPGVGAPTWVILDSDHRIRGMFVGGGSPTLQEDLITAIDDLLPAVRR